MSISILLVWLLLSFIMVFMVIRGGGVVRGGVILLCCMQSFLDTGCWYNFFFLFLLLLILSFSLFFCLLFLHPHFYHYFFLIVVFFHSVIDSFTLFFQCPSISFLSNFLPVFINFLSFLHSVHLFQSTSRIISSPSSVSLPPLHPHPSLFSFYLFYAEVNYSLWFFPSFLFIFLSFTSITQMFFPHI